MVRSLDSKKKKSRPILRFKKILVPIDFSDCSMKGVNYAKALARQFDATGPLDSVHVQYYFTSDEYSRYDFPLLMQQAEDHARKQMHDLVRKPDWNGIKVEPSLQVGHVGDQICMRAQEYGADLIVTSTHGTTGLRHVLLRQHRGICLYDIHLARSWLCRAMTGRCSRQKGRNSMRNLVIIVLTSLALTGWPMPVESATRKTNAVAPKSLTYANVVSFFQTPSCARPRCRSDVPFSSRANGRARTSTDYHRGEFR